MVCYLIDDDDDDRDFFAIALAEVDRTVLLKTAESAEKALQTLEAREVIPDIIFLDINMPRIDGWECLRLMRKLPSLKETPVIIYSTSDSGFMVPENPEHNGFLTKQARISELVKKLREIFSKTRYGHS